jgi:hypothetical protein
VHAHRPHAAALLRRLPPRPADLPASGGSNFYEGPVVTKREKELERMHLLSTIVNYPWRLAAEVADLANNECQHDLFDPLPFISPRGITAKLNAMSLAGLLDGSVTVEGIQWCATDEGERAWRLWLADREVEEAEARRAAVALPSNDQQEKG